MKNILLLILLFVLASDSFSQANLREEFNGPFESWAIVKTRFKAAGDGIKDDTKALQTASDSLSVTERVLFNDKTPSKYLVVYLPAGTYKISQTLRLQGKIGVSFIGEDPLKTIIKWEGGDNDTMFYSNRSAHQGKISLLDNYFLNNSKVQSSVDFTSWCKGNYDILSIDNSFLEENPNNLRKDFKSVVHSIEDKRIDAKAIRMPAIRNLQSFIPYVKRKLFEVPANSNSQAIQKIINTAAALKGQRAVVHFPIGSYNIDKTLAIPAGSDIQLIGDGLLYASVFKNATTNGAAFDFFKINGPSYITIKDLQIGQDSQPDKSNAFSFTNVDQQGSQVRIDQIYSKATNSIYIDRLNYTYFEKNNSFFSTGNTIIGGDKVKAGTGTSKLYCFGGQSAGVHLENNATMIARDCWWEGSYKKDFIPLNLAGNGNLTVDGAMYAPKDLDSGTIINVSNFTGSLALLNMYLAGGIDVKPNSPGLKMLVWNINNYYKKDPSSFLKKKMDSKIAMIGITTQCFPFAGITCTTGDPQSLDDISVNVANLNTFINDLTKKNRKAMPKTYINLADGISNI